MAGTIAADTLTHSTAGSIATNYVVEGSAKTWVNFNGTGTIATRTSFNVSSLTDNGTGDYTVTFSNAFSDESSANMTGGRSMFHYSSTGNTSNIRFRSKTLADALSDTTILTLSAHGDL
jgi:hypothetical protein